MGHVHHVHAPDVMQHPRTPGRYTETNGCSLPGVPHSGIPSKRTEATSTVDVRTKNPPAARRVPGNETDVRVESDLERIALVLSPRHSLKGGQNG
jgi:hypothetical protein